MGLKYPSNEVNNSNEFSPNFNMPMYANMHTYTSIFKQDAIALSTQSSYCLQTNIYSNISKLSEKPTDLSDETTYAKLINTTSITPLSNTDIAINSQILDENNNSRFYENINSHSTSIKMSKSSSSTHIYINFDHQEDIPPIIPTSNNQQEDIDYFPLYPIEKKQADIETRSNTSTIKTVKKLGVNMAPNCNDKSVSYHTKIPPTITQIHPSFRQRRTLHHSKRHRRRSSTPFRATMNSNAMRRQQQHSNLNANVHRPMIKHDQQMKSVSNRLYNEIQQPILNSVYSEKEVQVIEYPIQFHGALQHQILAWYPTVTYNEEELIPQVLSASENRELNQKDEIIDKEEEEVSSHDTVQDFPLRHLSTSSCSTSTSDTSTVTSEERPVRPPPLSRRSSGIALSLDKTDVDFIHDIIQRTHGDQRVSNRITALREAYVRAAIKRNDLLKTKPVSPITQNKEKKTTTTTKHSCITSKVRDELERYDELPIHRRAVFDDDSDSDDDDDDYTYSANDDHRFHRRTLPATPSTGHRILSFITTVKRQLQKSFHDIRSRILIETMAVPSNHVSRHRHIFHDPSILSRRHISRPQTSHDMVHRNNNQHSTEHFHPLHRHHLYRTHSSTSQIQSQHQHVHYPPSSEQHSSHRSHTYRTTSRQQRLQRID